MSASRQKTCTSSSSASTVPPSTATRLAVADDRADPRALGERQLADRLARSESPRAHPERSQPGRVVLDPPHRYPQPACDRRHGCSLDDDGEEDDDEDDPVDRLPVLDPADQGERGEQDRHRALEPAPHHEQALTPVEPHGCEERGDDERADRECEQSSEDQAVEPDVVLDQRVQLDREPERGEDDDLGEARERAEESLDLALARRGRVADQDPGDEDREKAGAVDRGRDAVDHAGRGEHAKRVERGLGKRDAAHQRQKHRRAGDSDRRAADHLDRELLDDGPEAAVVGGCELDHPDHQRDPGRVVRARLALQDRAGAPADLAAAEHRERDRGIGGGERCAEQAARDPAEVEEVVRRDRDQTGGREGAEHAEREDRDDRAAEAPPADVHAAVEEDHDQGDHGEPLDGHERDRIPEPREQVRCDCGCDEEERGARDRDPLEDASPEEREREARPRPRGSSRRRSRSRSCTRL